MFEQNKLYILEENDSRQKKIKTIVRIKNSLRYQKKNIYIYIFMNR